MAVGDAYVFPGFLTPVLTQLFFRKSPTTFPTCFCRGERRKYAGKKSRLNQGSNSQPPGHESDTLTTEPHRQGFIKQILKNVIKRALGKLNQIFQEEFNKILLQEGHDGPEIAHLSLLTKHAPSSFPVT